jgi:hypothetical protein
LAKPKTETIQKREQLKREQEERFTQECTFKPQTNGYRGRDSTEMRLEDRLHLEAELRAQNREQRKRELEDCETAAYTFKPQVEASAGMLGKKSVTRPPIYKRVRLTQVKEVQREKHESMQRLRSEFEQSDPELTFQPRLNPKVTPRQSARMAEQRKRVEDSAGGNVVDRLVRDAHDKIERRLRTAESIGREEVLKYPFAPQLSVASELAAGSVNFPGAFLSFMERQQAHLERVKSKQEVLQTEADTDPHCTFKPKIDKTSAYMVEAMPERVAETLESRAKRMSNDELMKRVQVRAQMESEQYAAYKFEPQINALSKQLGRSATLEELAYNAEGQRERKLMAEAQEHNYSFQPVCATSKKYAKVESDYRQGDAVLKTIEERQKERMEKLEALKKQQEFDELKSCAFRPQVTEKPAQSGPVVVHGMDRYLELREIAKRQSEEKKDREDKAFMVNVKHDPEHLYTVPRPFQLHPSNKEQRLVQLKQEQLERERMECTFQPMTLESRNRAVINRLLSQEDSPRMSVS